MTGQSGRVAETSPALFGLSMITRGSHRNQRHLPGEIPKAYLSSIENVGYQRSMEADDKQRSVSDNMRLVGQVQGQVYAAWQVGFKHISPGFRPCFHEPNAPHHCIKHGQQLKSYPGTA
jgi:hypothetical protein